MKRDHVVYQPCPLLRTVVLVDAFAMSCHLAADQVVFDQHIACCADSDADAP